MAVKLITGLPGSGKTTWTEENCQDGIIIHTDDLYYTRHDERLPKSFHEASWKDMCLNYTLNTIIDILAEDEKLYYLEGYHLLLWCGFDKLIKYMHKLLITDPEICYNNLIKKSKKIDELPQFTLNELIDNNDLIRKLKLIIPEKCLLNPFYKLPSGIDLKALDKHLNQITRLYTICETLFNSNLEEKIKEAKIHPIELELNDLCKLKLSLNEDYLLTIKYVEEVIDNEYLLGEFYLDDNFKRHGIGVYYTKNKNGVRYFNYDHGVRTGLGVTIDQVFSRRLTISEFNSNTEYENIIFDAELTNDNNFKNLNKGEKINEM